MSSSESFPHALFLRSGPDATSGLTARPGADGMPVACRPVVDVASGGLAAVSAAPAWSEIAAATRHPTCRFPSPARDLATRKGLPVTVVASLCRDYLTWEHQGVTPGFLVAALGAPRGLTRAAQAAAGLLSGRQVLAPDRLALMFDCDDVLEDPVASLHAFLDLKRRGFRLGIDFSDIEHPPFHILEMLPADYLRVRPEADQGIFRPTPTVMAGFAERLRVLCAFAENLLMDVIVAGVDSASKHGLLTDLRCRFGQGAYFPAVSPSEKSLGLFDTNGPPPGL